jgi:hypothetical protein
MNMVSLLSLWLPILISAVIAFVASWLLHMVVGHHRNDMRQLPQEDAALDILRAAQPGDYMAPYISSAAQMRAPEFVEKRRRGPVVVLTLSAGGELNMGKPLAQWFVYLLTIALISAYVASRTLAAGTAYLGVFRVVGTVAFMGLAMGHPHQSIWWKRQWSATLKYMIDGLIYALLMGGVFGWLWPQA